MHRARAHDGTALACKLQYPDMQSAVEADLQQLDLIFAIHRRMDPAIDTTEIAKEIGARIREELDYRREAKHVALYRAMLAGIDLIRVPRPWPELSTGRLLTLDWLEGDRMLAHKDDALEIRNRLAQAMFTAWWFPFSRFGVIHGDPHLGNYTVFERDGEPGGINLLDYGCIRIFPPKFVGGVVDLYHGLRNGDDALVVHAYETWGFKRLSRELIDIAQHLGALHLRAAAGRPGAQHRRRREALRIRPPRGLPGAPGAARRRGRSRCRANSCSWTAPPSGSAPCSCICARSSISTGCSTRRSRISRSSGWPRGRREALAEGRA